MKIGDKVKVRQLEDMVNEFGVLASDIPVREEISFVDEMKEWCGKTLTISRVYENDGLYISYDCYENDWEWVDEMFEKETEYQPKHAKENVNHPSHYNQGIEAIDYIESHNMGFNLGNVIKYVTRAKHKGSELEDLKKAKWYLEREIAKLEK